MRNLRARSSGTYRMLQTGLREHRELSDPRLAEFLDKQLGNLPLAVALNGHTLREMRRAPEKNPRTRRRTAARTVQDRAGAENSSGRSDSRKREMVV